MMMDGEYLKNGDRQIRMSEVDKVLLEVEVEHRDSTQPRKSLIFSLKNAINSSIFLNFPFQTLWEYYLVQTVKDA